jgi:hypothetical protein
MYLTNRERVLKVLWQLMTKPSKSPSYFHNLITESSPLTLKLPWWSYDAINFLRKLEFNNSFEWGSGGSTLFLANISGQLTTIENDFDWYNKLQVELKENQVDNVSLIKKDINLSSPENFKHSDYFNSLDKKYDLIAIDGEDHFGPDSTWSARVECFEKAQGFINPNGMIIVDDSWRYPEIEKLSRASSYIKFESLGPARRGVTSTDIYFY